MGLHAWIMEVHGEGRVQDDFWFPNFGDWINMVPSWKCMNRGVNDNGIHCEHPYSWHLCPVKLRVNWEYRRYTFGIHQHMSVDIAIGVNRLPSRGVLLTRLGIGLWGNHHC